MDYGHKYRLYLVKEAANGQRQTEPNLIPIIRETINSRVYHKSNTKWKPRRIDAAVSFAGYQWKHAVTRLTGSIYHCIVVRMRIAIQHRGPGALEPTEF